MSDLISRQDAIDAWDKLSRRGRTEFDQVLMTLPSAEPTGDLISREAVLSLFPNGFYSGLASQIKSLPSIKPIGDLISRHGVSAWLSNMGHDNLADMVMDEKRFPSAEPKTKCVAQIRIDRDDMEDLVNEKINEIVDKMLEPKTGKWIKVIDQETPNVVKLSHYECDQCGAWRYDNGQRYCSGCGARMNWGVEE